MMYMKCLYTEIFKCYFFLGRISVKGRKVRREWRDFWIGLNFLISIFIYTLIHSKYGIATLIEKETEAPREDALSKQGLLFRGQCNSLLGVQATALSPLLSPFRWNCYGEVFRENNLCLPLEKQSKLGFTFIIFCLWTLGVCVDRTWCEAQRG